MAKKKMTYEEAVSRIEEIVSKLENEQVPLDESIKLYKEGMELSLFCSKKLDRAQKEVEELKKDTEGNFYTAPFDNSDETEDDLN
ncbi:MAG: exodeoxyribonuclease VII small subunit [Clostridia bacterium]|jgi:exodeoxyribonuclease VII small subunit|nr:exodeoxyribonuclease VII small subunit [Clostridia bacterium]MCI2000934.1 exodeoxyribonuclease VII small subunit [Clostridia bacterium]MCI2015718.1 exodeoxyribonuclease VII small subunit [Clostridia bacterium]